MNNLFQQTSSLVSEIDSIVRQSQFNPLKSVEDRPAAPHASSPREYRMQKPIGVANEVKAAFPPLNAFAETSASTSVSAKNYYEPDLSSPLPPEVLFDAARMKFNGTAVSETEIQLRSILPKPVFLDNVGPLPVDPLIRASEVLPKDPTADSMLDQFNRKYGVSTDLVDNLPAIEDLSDKFLKNIDEERAMNDVQRDYRTVWESANKASYNPDVDTIQSLDKHLSTLWAKRYEYLVAEKNSANQRQQEGHYNPTEFAVDAQFVAEIPSPHAHSTLGTVRTFKTRETAPIPSIPNRVDFKPETTYYGPDVVATAVNIASLKPKGPNYFNPEYDTPYKTQKMQINLIPKGPNMDLIGDAEPVYKEPVDPNRLIPAASINSKPFSSKPHTDIIITNNGFIDPSYQVKI